MIGKSITLADFLTPEEIDRAIRLRDRKKVRDEIVLPNMARINEELGQENDPDYLAYAVEYVMTRSGYWSDE